MQTLSRQLLSASRRSWVNNGLHKPVGPAWLQWLWTLLFCMALAAVFTALGFFVSVFARGEGAWRNASGWATWYGRNLIVCLTVGSLTHLLFDLSRRLLDPARVQAWQPWQRSVFFSGVPLLGIAIGWPLGMLLAGHDVAGWAGSREGYSLIVGSVLLSLLMIFLMHHFFAAKSRQIEAEKRATEAQLRLLQGQIEPHFLFNTLANVLSLMDHDPPKARQMLESFTDHLRSSLATLRRDNTTLGDELDLVQTYLVLLKTRMDDRLQFSIDSPAALRSAKLPPLLLQPLVENAIHHGLEPKVDGGRLHVSARAEDRTLVLEVADDGLGLAPGPRRRRRGNGMALENLRERLAAQYGGDASLTLTDTAPGTCATLRLPLEPAA